MSKITWTASNNSRFLDSIGDVAAKCKAFGDESEISALFFGVGV